MHKIDKTDHHNDPIKTEQNWLKPIMEKMIKTEVYARK